MAALSPSLKAKIASVVFPLLVFYAWERIQDRVQLLVPSTDYTVAATLEGGPLEAELKQPKKLPGIYYVHLGLPSLHRYEWLGFNFHEKTVFVPLSIERTPHGELYIRPEMAHGARLTGSKIQDHWRVTFADDGAQCANDNLTVTLRTPPDKPAPEGLRGTDFTIPKPNP